MFIENENQPLRKLTTCESGQYYDAALAACESCSSECQTCSSSSTFCTSCISSDQTFNSVAGTCTCPSNTFLVPSQASCQGCMSKCSSCSNEYSCDTYSACPHIYQTLDWTTGQCVFNCLSGVTITSSQCGTCTDTNCEVCENMSNGEQHCGLCKTGFVLDLNTYTCVNSCPSNSFAISSTNTHFFAGTQVDYCRPYSNIANNYTYYVDSNSQSYLEMGTLEHPFKAIDAPSKEILNFMYSHQTTVYVFVMRGTHHKLYYGLMPIVLLNLEYFGMYDYGDKSLAKPYVYITDHAYQWPDSTIFSLTEASYDYDNRVYTIQDMAESEASTYFLKFWLIRANLNITSIDFQAIHFGSAWSNPIVYSLDAKNHSCSFEDCYLDLDGALFEAYIPIGLNVINSHINVTNYQYGVWNDFRWDCYGNNQTWNIAYIRITGTTFSDPFNKALYNFNFFGSFDDYIFDNNTIDGASWMNMATRPFLDIHPDSVCDPQWRSQRITHNNNTFVNLYDSNLIFNMNYMNNFNGTKSFEVVQNVFINSTINSQLILLQVSQTVPVLMNNNYFKNITVINGNQVIYFYGLLCDLPLFSETVVESVIDDLYVIGAVQNIEIRDFMVDSIQNTGSITDTSAIIGVALASQNLIVTNLTIQNSIFYYSKGLEIQAANDLLIYDCNFTNNSIQNANFIVLNSIGKAMIHTLNFLYFNKSSDENRFVLSFSTLSLYQNVSEYMVKDIIFLDSQSSFIQVSQTQLMTENDTNPYQMWITNCTVINNVLLSKDSLFLFGDISYSEFQLYLDNVTISNNSLQLGSIYFFQLNTKYVGIINSVISDNQGTFANCEPASSDVMNPLRLYVWETTFMNNYAMSDALIHLKTNSILNCSLSSFIENYSIGRGSVTFADYQKVEAYFLHCTLTRNYAYQGAVFYIQYSSFLQIKNCSIMENFAITGGVAYVNNDGQIEIEGSSIISNSAINTCIIFLINSQYTSIMHNLIIKYNDQKNPLIEKTQFQNESADFKHLNSLYLQGMRVPNIASKIERTVREQTDSAIYLILGKVNITDTIIEDNDQILSASTQSHVFMNHTVLSDTVLKGVLVQLVSSTFEVYNSVFNNITYIPLTSGVTSSYYKILVVNKSVFIAQKFNFTDTIGPLLYASGTSEVNITHDCVFYNHTNDAIQSGLIEFQSSNVYIDTAQFYELYSKYYYQIFVFQNNKPLQISNTNLYKFNKTLIGINGGSYSFQNINIWDCLIDWQSSEMAFGVNSVVFEVSNVNDILLDHVEVNDMYTTLNSPILYAYKEPTSITEMTITIKNSTFRNNSAEFSAGVAEIINCGLVDMDSIYDSNSALNENGGVFSLKCDANSQKKCEYTFNRTKFHNNFANLNGGAIEYNFYKPNDTDVEFINNTAIYGSNISSYAVNISMNDMSQFQPASSRMLIDGPALLSSFNFTQYNITNNSLFYLFPNDLVSGLLLTSNFSLNLYDKDGNLLVTDSSSQATVQSQTPDVTIMQTKTVTAQNGTFTFQDAIIIGPPGSPILLKVTTDVINQNTITKAFPELPAVPDIYLVGQLRLCVRKEYQSADNKCLICQNGFYTLFDNQTQCQPCPEHSNCNDGDNITVDEGYWRQDINSSLIFECYNIESCPSNNDTTCAVGYDGNLCQSCSQNDTIHYYRYQANVCSECVEKGKNQAILSLIALLILVYIGFLIFINIYRAGTVNKTSIYFRIITNYFQILSLTQSFNLNWSDQLRVFLETISFVGQSSSQVLSIECFLYQNNVSTTPAFIEMGLAVLIIFLLIVISVIFFIAAGWLLYINTNEPQSICRNITLSVIIIVFVTLPTISSITLSLYNCIDIFNDGDAYLALDMSVQCWSGDHQKYAINYGLPIVILWIIGMPFVTGLFLLLKRKKLDDKENLARYGFLYMGLTQRAFYWEILLHYRKVLIISINIFFTTFASIYRALIGFMIMIIYIEILQRVEPYTDPQMNDVEFKANIAAFTTFYGGLFLINDDIPNGIQMIIFLLIIGMNLFFFLTWLARVLPKYYMIVRNNLCPCIKNKSQDSEEKLFEKEQQDESEDADQSNRSNRNLIQNQKKKGAQNYQPQTNVASQPMEQSKRGSKMPFEGTKKGSKQKDDYSNFQFNHQPNDQTGQSKVNQQKIQEKKKKKKKRQEHYDSDENDSEEDRVSNQKKKSKKVTDKSSQRAKERQTDDLVESKKKKKTSPDKKTQKKKKHDRKKSESDEEDDVADNKATKKNSKTKDGSTGEQESPDKSKKISGSSGSSSNIKDDFGKEIIRPDSDQYGQEDDESSEIDRKKR